MKFFFAKVFILVFFIGASNANENIRFININYILNNSEVGKTLNKIIENKKIDFFLCLPLFAKAMSIYRLTGVKQT